MKSCFFILTLVLQIHLSFVSAFASDVRIQRQYEPVIITGSQLPDFTNFPLESLYLFSFDNATKLWKLIPFQFDEILYAPDPFHLPDTVWKYCYFLPDDGLLDADDELVFITADLGDKAVDCWLDDSEARSFSRIEIHITTEDDPVGGYVYLYRLLPSSRDIPRYYSLNYDLQNQIVRTRNYTLGLDQSNGVIKDIKINPPYGSGVDIFDTQKIRFAGLIDLGGSFPISIGRTGSYVANERDNFYQYNSADGRHYFHYATPDPIVRIVREVRMTIRFGSYKMHDIAFYVQSKFYPFNATLTGGASLDPAQLKENLNTTEDIYIELDLLRQSWDFNSSAKGMHFYNNYNSNIPIDGNPDIVNTRLDIPIKEWTLTSGDQGSVFMYTVFTDTAWKNVQLYYHDNDDGSQGDGTLIPGGDTGDTLSFGDQGIYLRNLAQRSANLDLGFTAYFLEANLDKEAGLALAKQVEFPVNVETSCEVYKTAVKETDDNSNFKFRLLQNYPNPFNSSTAIIFNLGKSGKVQIIIYNAGGQIVKQLCSRIYSKGSHQIIWHGMNNDGLPVVSGIYYAQIKAGSKQQIKKLILIR